MARLAWLDAVSDPSAVRRELRQLVEREVQARQVAEDELKTIYLFLTRKCNLGCAHCYIKGVGPTARDQDFDLDTIASLIEQALPHGLRKVKVSGGEPFVHKQAMEILEYLSTLPLAEIVLETNGTLFHDNTVERLARIRNLTVFVSLDNADSASHDAFRGQAGAYSKTIDVLLELGATDVKSVVTSTAYRFNYDQIPEIVELVLGWGISRHRTLLNIHPLGNARGHLDNAITLEECEQLVGRLIKTQYYRDGRAYVTLPPALLPLKDLGSVHTCGWGDSVLGILSTGEVSMCSASYDDPEMIAGSAYDTPLIDLWRNSAFFNDLKEIANGKVKGVCSNCVFYRACRGVCKMSSYAHYGEKDAPYPLCQEIYNQGLFPDYALVDPERDCSYRPGAIRKERECGSAPELVQLSLAK